MSLGIILLVISALILTVGGQGASIVSLQCENKNNICVSPPSQDCDGISNNRECMTNSIGAGKDETPCTDEEYEKLKFFYCKSKDLLQTLQHSTKKDCDLMMGKCLRKITFVNAKSWSLSQLKSKTCSYAKNGSKCMEEECLSDDIKEAETIYCGSETKTTDFFESILKDFRSEYAIYLKHCIHEDSQDVCYDVKEREHCIIIPKRGSNESTEVLKPQYEKIKFFVCKIQEIQGKMNKPKSCSFKDSCKVPQLGASRNLMLSDLKAEMCSYTQKASKCLRYSCDKEELVKATCPDNSSQRNSGLPGLLLLPLLLVIN